jgi:hypothetical protein
MAAPEKSGSYNAVFHPAGQIQQAVLVRVNTAREHWYSAEAVEVGDASIGECGSAIATEIANLVWRNPIRIYSCDFVQSFRNVLIISSLVRIMKGGKSGYAAFNN